MYNNELDEIFMEGYYDALEDYDCLDESFLNFFTRKGREERKKRNDTVKNQQDTINSQAARIDNLGHDLQRASKDVVKYQKKAERNGKIAIKAYKGRQQARNERDIAIANDKRHKTQRNIAIGGASAALAGLGYKLWKDKKEKEEETKKNEAFEIGYNDAMYDILNED